MTRGQDGTADVAAIGDCVVDLVATDPDPEWLDALAATHDWFPRRGESRSVDRETFRAATGDAFEEACWERYHGGKAANQAAAAAEAGATTAFYGTIGTDTAPLDDLAGRGVDVAAVERVAAPTTTAYVFPEGEETRDVGVADPATLVDADYVAAHAGALWGAAVLLVPDVFARDAQRRLLDGPGRDCTVVYDPRVDTPSALIAHPAVDYLTPNVHEAAALPVDGVAATVVRTSADGARAGDVSVAAPSVEVVDTTGAGDVFNGTLAARLADGASLREALADAVEAASAACTYRGARP